MNDDKDLPNKPAAPIEGSLSALATPGSMVPPVVAATPASVRAPISMEPTALLAGQLSAPAAPGRSDAVMVALTPASIKIPIPRELAEQIDGINQWAKANRREARWESVWFWALKVPVIVATAGYGLLAKNVSAEGIAWVGAISAGCVLVDGLLRPGILRNFHHRAYFELRTIADDLFDQWDAAALLGDERHNVIASHLIEDARKRKAKVAAYLADAEASLGKGSARKGDK